MQLSNLYDLFSNLHGSTFAFLDSITTPRPGIRKVTFNDSVILFSNCKCSGYENMVKRKMEQLGYDPEAFSVSSLPFGERIDNTPLISHRGRVYLQTVLLSEGMSVFFLGAAPDRKFWKEIDPVKFGIKKPKRRLVEVRTFDIDHITELRLLNTTVR